MQVGELFLALGLFVDEKEWNLGQAVIDKMTAEMKRLAVSAVTASLDVKKAMGVIGLEVPKQKTNLEKIADSGNKVTHTFRNMIAAAAGFFAIGGVKEMITEVVDLGGKLNDAAQATGLSAEELQWWGYAAKQNSSDIDGIIGGTKKLAKNLAGIKPDGTDPASKALTELGISLHEPAVKARDLNGVMFLISNAFAKMPDGGKKTALAMELLGKTGADLIPTLNNGVQGLMAYRKEADDLGGVMSGQTVSALDDVGDNIDRVKFAWQGIKQQAITALLPMLKDTVDSVLAWVKANKELLAQRIQSVVSQIVTVVTLMAKALLFAVKHWKALAALFAAGSIVSGIMGITKAIIFFQSAQAAAAGEAVIAWLAILGPILLVMAAGAALGLLMYKFRDQVSSALSAVADFFAMLGRKIWGAISWAWNKVTDGVDFVATKIHNAFESVFGFIADKVAWIGDKLEYLSDKAKKVMDALGDAGRSAADDLFDTLHGDGLDHSDEGDSSDSAAQRARNRAWSSALGPDSVGATSGTAPGRGVSVPARSGGAPTATITNSYSVMINAGSADAKEVGNVVDQKLKEHDERTRRQTAASLGI